METNRLGRSEIYVSEVCLGTMTWGVQNTQADADRQLQVAMDAGVNFLDTAEMYAIPPSPDTYGKTETILGNWLARHPSKRDKWIVATKMAGPGLSWIRDGKPMTGQDLVDAVDASLQRLQTDYIDLYQLHWPNRTHPHFAKHWPGDIGFSNTSAEQQKAEMLDLLNAAQRCIEQGKIRHLGLSDETPWGIAAYLQLSREHNVPRIVSIQNEFNLLHSKDWPYLIEQCCFEDVAYLPWSPLAAGALSGKYLNGQRPLGSRWTLMQRNGLFRDTPAANQAVAAYKAIAEQHNLTSAQLALAWVRQVEGVTSTIIGATSETQLKENLAAFSARLSDTVLNEIAKVHKTYPAPY